MFQTEVVEENKTYNNVKIYQNNVDKYGTGRHTTDDNIILHISFACSINSATGIHSEYVKIIGFGYVKAFQCNNKLTLSVLFTIQQFLSYSVRTTINKVRPVFMFSHRYK